MKCPYCAHPDSKVIDSRSADEGERIRRRRECLVCHRRFTTYETVETTPVIVIKKDGSREAFERNKLLRGMLRACEKRPISIKELEAAVDDIALILQSEPDKEVPSQRIGTMCLERLAEIDEVAYIRFASVYRQFKDIQSFMRELSEIIDRKEKKNET